MSDQYQSKERCETLRQSANDKVMQEIKEVKEAISDLHTTLTTHIAVEEKWASIIKIFIWFWFPIIAWLIWLVWDNLNDKIVDIQDLLKNHEKQIIEMRLDINDLDFKANEHEKEDEQVYKIIKKK